MSSKRLILCLNAGLDLPMDVRQHLNGQDDAHTLHISELYESSAFVAGEAEPVTNYATPTLRNDGLQNFKLPSSR